MTRLELSRPADDRPAPGAAPIGTGFRTDIAGLRAVAVGLVLLYHAGLPWLSGGYVGVDVFFVISGFLMTSLIVKEIDRTGTVGLRAFYARRIRRLLPAAIVVLVATVATAKLLLPPLALPDISVAAIATGLYVSNIWLAVDGTDYLASEEAAPLQHYWSLGVEEQFYLVWPVALLVAFALMRRMRIPVACSVAVLCLASLVLCGILTPISQPWAFFSLPTRAWELGVGGLVALAGRRLERVPPIVARAASWTGLLVLAATAVLYTETTPFPGWTAAVPVAAAAAVIAGGPAGGAGGAVAVLQPSLLQYGGRLSYSLYLWHWPVLVLPAAALGELDGWTRAALVVVAIGLAWATYTAVERPVLDAPSFGDLRRCYLLGAWLTVVAVGAGLLAGVQPRLTAEARVQPLTSGEVARAVPAPADDVPANVTPALPDVDDDVPTIYDDCHGDFFDEHPPGCVFGEPDSDRSVYLMGDSHAAQWFPALERVAIEDGWRLIVVTKNACPAFDLEVMNEQLGRSYDECERWRATTLARIQVERPDVVVVGSYSASYRDLMPPGQDFRTAWSGGLARLVAELPAESRAVVLGDSPTWPTAPAHCLSANVDDPDTCSAPTAELVDEAVIEAEAQAAAAAGAIFVPTTPWLCTDRCQALSANVVVYRDRHHVTATFAELLGRRFSAVLHSATMPR